jgi:hypothetical protein
VDLKLLQPLSVKNPISSMYPLHRNRALTLPILEFIMGSIHSGQEINASMIALSGSFMRASMLVKRFSTGDSMIRKLCFK